MGLRAVLAFILPVNPFLSCQPHLVECVDKTLVVSEAIPLISSLTLERLPDFSKPVFSYVKWE